MKIDMNIYTYKIHIKNLHKILTYIWPMMEIDSVQILCMSDISRKINLHIELTLTPHFKISAGSSMSL